MAGPKGLMKRIFTFKNKAEVGAKGDSRQASQSKKASSTSNGDGNVKAASSESIVEKLQPGQSKEDWAALQIQTSFRAHLTRRAYRALKGLIRLQALVRGHIVRKQAAVTLRCMHALVRVQARVRARQVRMSKEGMAVQRQIEMISNLQKQDYTQKRHEAGWCEVGGSLTDLQSKLQSKQEGVIKRERAAAYANSHARWAKLSKDQRSLTFIDCEPDKGGWGWSWLERWMVARPWENRVMMEQIASSHNDTWQPVPPGSLPDSRALSISGTDGGTPSVSGVSASYSVPSGSREEPETIDVGKCKSCSRRIRVKATHITETTPGEEAPPARDLCNICAPTASWAAKLNNSNGTALPATDSPSKPRNGVATSPSVTRSTSRTPTRSRMSNVNSSEKSGAYSRSPSSNNTYPTPTSTLELADSASSASTTTTPLPLNPAPPNPESTPTGTYKTTIEIESTMDSETKSEKTPTLPSRGTPGSIGRGSASPKIPRFMSPTVSATAKVRPTSVPKTRPGGGDSPKMSKKLSFARN